jgi:hypothetical protein
MNETRKTVIPLLITELDKEITQTHMHERKLWDMINYIKYVDAAPREEPKSLFPQTIEDMLKNSIGRLKYVNAMLAQRLDDLSNLV